MSESEEKLVKHGNLVLNQHDTKFQITRKVGAFTFRCLTPVQRAGVEGRVAARLFNSMGSMKQTSVDIMLASSTLDEAIINESAPPGWQSFNAFPDPEFIMDVYTEYSEKLLEFEKKVRDFIDKL